MKIPYELDNNYSQGLGTKMNRKVTALIVTCLLTSTLLSGIVLSQKRDTLDAEQQKNFLARRLPSGAITGTFAAYGSFLYAALLIAIHTDDKDIGETELHSPFPDFYKPTVRELLDTIALQTKSSWAYDSQTNYWTFAKPAAAQPFSLKLVDKWTTEDRGFYVTYRPPTYPVGMDVYYYGSYSADDPSEQRILWERVRNSWATGFASRLKRHVTISEMQSISVDGVEALYFQAPAPRPDVTWRQWAFVKYGHAFVIVSTLPSDDQKLLADVEAMVKSFQVVSPPGKFVKKKNAIPNRYIVVLRDDVVDNSASLEERRARVVAVANTHAKTFGGKVDYIYETALKGYAIQLPNEAAAISISKLPEVRWVEEDALGTFF